MLSFLKNKFIWLGLGLLLVAVLVFSLINRPLPKEEGKYRLYIKTVPSDATIKIYDKEYKSPVEMNILPGVYNIKVERFGFNSINFTADIRQEDADFFVPLNPLTDEAKKWMRENQHLYAEIDAKNQQQATESATKAGEKFPLFKYLPNSSTNYSLSGYVNEDGEFVINIIGEHEMLYEAVRYLKSHAIDLTPYRHDFFNATKDGASPNPFIKEDSELDEETDEEDEDE